MPVIKSAKKKLRQDQKRETQNRQQKSLLKSLVKKASKSLNDDSIKSAFSAVDKAAKKHIIHRNKAARVKSKLSKLAAKSHTSSKSA